MVMLGILLVGVVMLVTLLHTRGWQLGWKAWGISTQNLAWLDLRVISGAMQTLREGGDPYLSNPHDPMGRLFNYPSLWLTLWPSFSASEAGLTVIAIGFTGLAVIALHVWMGPSVWLTGSVLGLLILSPGLMLAVERGNTDLFIFALLAVGLSWVRQQGLLARYSGVALLLLATLLKLYPALALLVAVVCAAPRVRWAAGVALGGALVWLLVHKAETLASLGNTQIGVVHSYGRSVLPLALDLRARSLGQVVDVSGVKLFVNAFAVFCLAVGGWRGVRLGAEKPQSSEAHYLSGWLVGGGIFLATFLAGFSFNYRLWFLLLGVPWMLEVAKERGERGGWARMFLVLFCVVGFASGVWDLDLVWVGQTAGWGLFLAGSVLWATAAVQTWRDVQSEKSRVRN